jgi:hypothetical protein
MQVLIGGADPDELGVRVGHEHDRVVRVDRLAQGHDRSSRLPLLRL